MIFLILARVCLLKRGSGIKLVRHLKAIRNSLSHLETINPEILLCQEMTNWHQILNIKVVIKLLIISIKKYLLYLKLSIIFQRC